MHVCKFEDDFLAKKKNHCPERKQDDCSLTTIFQQGVTGVGVQSDQVSGKPGGKFPV